MHKCPADGERLGEGNPDEPLSQPSWSLGKVGGQTETPDPAGF